MGRKNNRIQLPQDNNFIKFMDTVNNSNKKPDTNPKRNKRNDVSQYEKQRSNPVKSHQQFNSIQERNRERVRYSTEQFTRFKIQFEILNEDKAIIKVHKKSDKTEFIYYASTGMLKDIESIRGLKNIIAFLNE